MFTVEVWNPIDEAQHYSYVESIATGNGLPVVGEDKLSSDILEIAKASPTQPFQSQGYLLTEDFDWGAFGESYEGGGVQGPVYYTLLVPAYWASHPFGETVSIYTLRMFSVVLSLLAVPLLWLLARRMFPDQPYVWLMAPALLVLIQGFNANVASINNDALVVPVCIAAMIPVTAAFRGLQMNQAVFGGALLGMALLTKATATPLALYTGFVLLWLLVSRRESLTSVARWGLVYGAVAVAVVVPYLAWNLYEYGSLSASDQVNLITGPVQEDLPWSLDSLKMHFHNARAGFWDLQPLNLGTHSDYVRLLQWSAVCIVLVGLAAAIWKRDRDGFMLLSWLGLAFPVAFIFKLATTYLLFDGLGTVVGRHMYVSIGLIALAISAGLVMAFGRRVGLGLFLALIGFALVSERELTNHYVDGTYTLGVLNNNLAPVIDQPVNEGLVMVDRVEVDTRCPAEALAITSVRPLASLNVTSERAQKTWEAPHLGRVGVVDFYILPEPAPGPLTVRPGVEVAYSPNRDHPLISAPGVDGDPVLRVYCSVDNAGEQRFEQLYPPLHPNFSQMMLKAWPTIWYWIGWAAVLAAVIILGHTAYATIISRRGSSPRSTGDNVATDI